MRVERGQRGLFSLFFYLKKSSVVTYLAPFLHGRMTTFLIGALLIGDGLHFILRVNCSITQNSQYNHSSYPREIVSDQTHPWGSSSRPRQCPKNQSTSDKLTDCESSSSV